MNKQSGINHLLKKINKVDEISQAENGKGIVHTYSQKSGSTLGKYMKMPATYAAKKTNIFFFEEIGDAVQGSMTFSGNMAGQFAQGTWKTLQSTITRDKNDLSQGLNEYQQLSKTLLKALYESSKMTIKNSSDFVHGAYIGDSQKMKGGLKGIGKMIIVGGLTFTFFDLVSGEDATYAEDGDMLITQNGDLEGQVHPETGVPYEVQTVELPNGNEVIGVFPVFNPVTEVQLPINLYEGSDYQHFDYANEELASQIQENLSLAGTFTEEQVEQILAGETPDDYTWHHHEQTGLLQLVDEETHAKSAHSGGRFIWGGGSDAR